MIPLGVLASSYVAPAGGTTGFVTSRNDATGLSSRTYADVSLGTAASDRTIIVAAHSRYRNISSATIAGVTATLVQGFSDGFARVTIFTASVPTGTTGDIVITHDNTPEADAIGVWAAYGTLAYSTHATSGTTNAVTLTAPSDCLCIAALTDIQDPDTYTGALADYFETAFRITYTDCTGEHSQPAAGSHTVTVPVRGTYGSYALLAVDFTLT